LQLGAHKKTYLKLLAKYNRLVNKCEKEKVSWHKDVEGKSKKKKL
jgi:hypothetical protein